MTKGLFAGLAGIDITYYQSVFPMENFKSKTNDFRTFIGGPAANAAITYSILGGDATLVTCLGDTPIARSMKIEFSEMYDVTVIDLAECSKLLPSISSALVNVKSATRTIWSGQQQFDISENTNIEKWISDASFCFSDCNLPEATIDFLKRSKKLGKRIVLDPGSWKPHFSTCLPLADEVIASVHCRPPADDLVSYLHGTDVQKIALTDGENDTVWFDLSNGEQGVTRVPKVEAVDTLAAGDVLHGAYCYYRYHIGLTFVEALEKATAVASESVKYFGAREGVYKMIQS